MPITQVDFACRLPFLQQVAAGHWQAGFLSLPSGTFAADPDASSLIGYYDRAVSKWLPVGRNAVAPDGLNYAFLSGGVYSQPPGPPRLHVVDAATGVERVIDLALPDSQPYGLDVYAADGIYIGSSWEGVVINGHWRVDPASGRLVALGTTYPGQDDGTGHSWRGVVDPRDPKPARSVMDGHPMSNEIVRRDLKTGLEEIWFYHPGFSLAIAGTFVGGGILVWAEPDSASNQGTAFHEYWVVSGPGRALFVADIESGGQTMADGHGIWMGSYDGLYLFTRDGRIRRVAGVPGEPANGCF